MDLSFSTNELIAIYASIKHLRETTTNILDKMDFNDPDRDMLIENNVVYNSILRKLNNIFSENDIKIDES
ncbi:MAG: hypothetical protein IJD45_01090 [Clostridia bacterium]|nr:hypothetical protein [Clostridia bacterium]